MAGLTTGQNDGRLPAQCGLRDTHPLHAAEENEG